MIGRMLDHLRRVLGGDGPIAVFTGNAVACECDRREAVLWVGLTPGTKTHLFSEKSGNRTDLPEAGVVAWMKVLLQCLALGATVYLIYQKSDLLLELLPVGLLETGIAARAVVLLPEVGLAAGAVVLDLSEDRPYCWGKIALLEASFADGALLCQRSALLLGWLCFAGSLLCPWGGGVFDLPEVGLTVGVVAYCSARCRLYRRGDCDSLGMPRSCDKGLELRLELKNPEGSESQGIGNQSLP
ncbi:hypothetical protein CDL15_Pgr020300 [Punica granatum]|uniref:Uncharacterized protein n=1 Tax=Punica granatum TaxID=22663 RepID=A0A218Y3H1_PUNGR|nr:hypothetical protein CDL15_Pgr020300 [Punica granatum]